MDGAHVLRTLQLGVVQNGDGQEQQGNGDAGYRGAALHGGVLSKVVAAFAPIDAAQGWGLRTGAQVVRSGTWPVQFNARLIQFGAQVVWSWAQVVRAGARVLWFEAQVVRSLARVVGLEARVVWSWARVVELEAQLVRSLAQVVPFEAQLKQFEARTERNSSREAPLQGPTRVWLRFDVLLEGHVSQAFPRAE
jgi:hypothetical protein